MPTEKGVTINRTIVKGFVMTNSLRNGIVLWELREQKCQQRVCQLTDVVETGQAGWMVLILQWKMVKLSGRFALATVRQVANLHYTFLLLTVDLSTSTNLPSS